MLKKVLCTTICILFLVGSPFSFALSNHEETGNGNQMYSPENIKKRAKYGLSSTSLSSNLNQDTHIIKYEDFYVTEEEAVMLDQRFQDQENNIPQLIQNLKSTYSEDRFGGVFINQEEGGKVYARVKSVSKEDQNLFNSMKKSLPEIILLDAKFSESELNKIHEQIFSSKDELKQIGIDIKYIATDIKNNKVEVGLTNASEDNQNYLRNLYGDALVFYEANDSQFKTEGDTVTATYPIQGGTQLLNSTAGLYCSTGFSAKKGTTYYVVTAGHCLAGTYYQPNTTASGRYSPGIAEGANVIENGSVDALLITSSSSVVSNKVYYQYVGAKSLTGYVADSSEFVGEHVCVASRSNDTCGTIKSTNISVGNLSNLTGADYTAIPGDSGGTIFGNNKLYGIHRGDGTLNGNHVEVYTQVQNIMNKFGITPILN